MNEPASEMNYTVVHKKKIPIPELLLLSARDVHTPNSYDATSLFSPYPFCFLPPPFLTAVRDITLEN